MISAELFMFFSRYALQVGPKILSFYEEYFQIPYPLPKQDMIAVPSFEGLCYSNFTTFILDKIFNEKIAKLADLLIICFLDSGCYGKFWLDFLQVL